MNSRVVITGLGLSTPVGRGVEACWSQLLAGRSGIGPITLFDASTLPVRIGGEVRGLPLAELAAQFPACAGESDRKIWLGLDAATHALGDAELRTDALENAALFLGVSLENFCLEAIAPAVAADDLAGTLARHALQTAPRRPLQTPLDQLTVLLAQRYGFRGGRWINCSACAAGAQALGEAFHLVREGARDLALAGAADSTLNPLGLGGFSLLHILAEENERPEKACRPFDATRQGTVLSEASAFVVLENLAHAQRRGARIYAEVVGYASSLDAFRVTDPEPDGRGAILSMSKALADARLQPAQIDAVNAHGTGTPKNDIAETLAIKQALGARAKEIPVTANKSMTGHCISASGAVEAAASALMLARGQIPPTINLEHPDPRCDLDYVAGGRRAFAGRTVLSNSFGFGGQNATLIFQRYEP
ncbi:MAG: beta-ketoacyl-[acyl-carrier-protein] synthase family protein [Kiritimatiellaeota bacterium]|nr:beta-ketoacyl-[acyl-carrier-protein] synthase family protein [Kiritimatiellota bacterium]